MKVHTVTQSYTKADFGLKHHHRDIPSTSCAPQRDSIVQVTWFCVHPPRVFILPIFIISNKARIWQNWAESKSRRLLMSNNKNSTDVLHSKLLQQMGPALPVCSHSACDDRTKISALSTPEIEVHKGGRVKAWIRPVSSVSRVEFWKTMFYSTFWPRCHTGQPFLTLTELVFSERWDWVWWLVAEIISLCCNMLRHNRICYIKKRDYPILLSVHGHKAE